MKLLALLLGFFRPAVDDPPADPPADGEPPADAPSTGDDQLDLDLAQAGADETPAPLAGADDLEAERTRAREATERAERAEREAAELRIRSQPVAHTQDPDADLRAVINDAAADPQKKWKAEADLVLRQNTRASQTALFQAEDLRDQTAFQSLATSQPAIHKRYAERVEKELATLRSRGQNASRAAVLRYMLGDDMMNGKLKKKAAAPGAPKGPDRRPPPSVRSDQRPGAMSEREKRAKRLENVQI